MATQTFEAEAADPRASKRAQIRAQRWRRRYQQALRRVAARDLKPQLGVIRDEPWTNYCEGWGSA